MGNKDSKPFSGKLYRILVGHSGKITSVKFSPNEKFLATCSEQMVIIWNMKNLKPYCTFRGHNDIITSCCFTADSRQLVTSSLDHSARAFRIDFNGAPRKLKCHTKGVLHCSAHHSELKVATCSEDSLVVLWDLSSDSPTKKKLVGHKLTVNQCSFCSDGVLLASCSNDHMVILWNCSSGKQIMKLREPSSQVWTCPFSPDGTLLACVVDNFKLNIWSHVHNQIIKVLDGVHNGYVLCCDFMPHSERIVTGSEDRSLVIWETSVGKSTPFMVIKSAHSQSITTVCFSPSGKMMVSGSSDTQIKVWI